MYLPRMGGAPSTCDRLKASSSLQPAINACRVPAPTWTPQFSYPHTTNSLDVSSSSSRRSSTVCRVTNTSEEVYRAFGKNPDDDDEITINNTQVHYPELGSLESRVTKFYLDELFTDTGPDMEETAYWFHTPPGGWRQGPLRLKTAEEAPVTFSDPTHVNWEQEGRISINEVDEGQVITGTISDIWLYHGCQVDFGYEFDGLVPMSEECWMEPGVRDHLMPGDQVVVKVVAVRQPGLYRWPVQLQLLEPATVASKIMLPEDYVPSINHAWAADQGWDMEDIIEATGRDYEPSQYMIPMNEAEVASRLQQEFGYDTEFAGCVDKLHPMEERVNFLNHEVDAAMLEFDGDVR